MPTVAAAGDDLGLAPCQFDGDDLARVAVAPVVDGVGNGLSDREHDGVAVLAWYAGAFKPDSQPLSCLSLLVAGCVERVAEQVPASADTAHRHQGDVALGAIADEAGEDRLLEPQLRKVPVVGDDLGQTVEAGVEPLAPPLDEPVGIEQQQRSSREERLPRLDAGPFQIPVRAARSGPPRGRPHHRSVTPAGGWVSCAGVGHPRPGRDPRPQVRRTAASSRARNGMELVQGNAATPPLALLTSKITIWSAMSQGSARIRSLCPVAVVTS